MIDVYILLSNEFSFLDIQIPLIQKNVEDLNKIYAVMGPIGSVSSISTNIVKNVKAEQIILPPDRQFFPQKQVRIPRIINYIMENYGDKNGNTALFLHADIFPIALFKDDPTLNIFGKGGKNKSNLAVTWLCIKPGFRLHNYEIDKSYNSVFPTGDGFKKIFGTAKENGLNIEWCNPCFIHTDDSSINRKESPELSERKLKFIKDYVQLKESLEFDENQVFPQDIISLTKRYAQERKRWIEAGKPLRSPEEIRRIFQICSACPFFLAESAAKGSCTICGCQIKNRGRLMNKAAWATTECPKIPSEWTEDRLTSLVDTSNMQPKKCCGQ